MKLKLHIAAILVLVAVSVQAQSEVNLLAMGDWGSGKAEQKEVAKTMSDYVAHSGKTVNGALLVGDNFYVKLSGIDDPQWQSLFENMYDPATLKFPFFAALGNHDMENGKMQIELDYAKAHPDSRWKMPTRWFRVDLPQDKPLVSVLVLDSNKNNLKDDEWQQQLDWMKQQLDDRKAKWVICCAHHPVYSNGNHGDNGVLQKAWDPLFDKGKVDFYICGHDHDLQHLEIPGVKSTLMLVGGGGQTTKPERVDKRGPFSRQLYGFAHLDFTETNADVKYVDSKEEIVHEFSRTPDGQVKILSTTASDKATPRTVKSISRDDDTETPATAPATQPDKK